MRKMALTVPWEAIRLTRSACHRGNCSRYQRPDRRVGHRHLVGMHPHVCQRPSPDAGRNRISVGRPGYPASNT